METAYLLTYYRYGYFSIYGVFDTLSDIYERYTLEELKSLDIKVIPKNIKTLDSCFELEYDF